MNRRRFIGMTAAGAVSLVGAASGRDDEYFALMTLAHPQLIDVLRDERVVHNLGLRYRERVPAEDNAGALAQAIRADLPSTASAPPCALVREQVQREFARGRTVTLNGWVLSVTEARQCALFSLLPA